LVPRFAFELGPDTREGKQRPIIVQGEPDDVLLGLGIRFWGVFRKTVGRTRHRLPGFSQQRQCDDDVLRILVTGGPPLRGGVGIPQRIVVSSRSASTLRTTGAGMWLIAFIGNESLTNV
jgi:hypothetical protein